MAAATFVSIPFVGNAAWLGPLAVFAEPYCAAAVLTYVVFRPFRRSISKLREKIFSLLDDHCKRLNAIHDQGWHLTLDESQIPKTLVYYLDDMSWVRVELGFDQDVFIKSLQTKGLSYKNFVKLIENFNWAARENLKTAFKENSERFDFGHREVVLKIHSEGSECATSLLHGRPAAL